MPGLKGTGCARNVLVQGCLRRAFRLGLVSRRHAQEVADSHGLQVLARFVRCIVGKELQHLIVELSLPSAMARPTAVEVKLLLSE